MEVLWNFLIQEWDVVKNVKEKEERMLESVSNVKDKADQFKCIKLLQACISKCKKFVRSVQGRVNWWNKVTGAQFARVKK